MKNKLLKYQDKKYQEFSKRILPGIDNIIGIRIPTLRKLSKQLKLEELSDSTFEEIMLQGMIISNIKDIDELVVKMDTFIPKINNWSICDSFVSSLKITNDNLEKLFNHIIAYQNGSCYEKRFMIVMFLNYYLIDKYIDKIIKIIKNINYDEYYTMMAIAWLLSKMYINYKNEVIKLFDENCLNKELINKTISKIRDSYLIDKDDKEYILKYKIL